MDDNVTELGGGAAREEPDAVAARIAAANRYLALGTADGDGRPWVSPVWYAASDLREFLWVSSPQARHSRNVAARREVSIAIFDSGVPVGGAEAVYVAAVAEELAGDELERGIAVFSRRSEGQGLRPWSSADVRPPARHRLYRATALEAWVLGPGDERVPVAIR